MGKNLYETPRDMNKWHTQKNSHDNGHAAHQDDKQARLEALKKRFKEKKK